MLKPVALNAFSPSALLASLRTSDFHVRNRTIGVPMALIKKRDLADYYAARRLKGNQIYVVPPSQPDATGFSGNEPLLGDAKPMEFHEDATADHSLRNLPLRPPVDSNTPKVQQVRAALGRAQERNSIRSSC